MGESSDTMPIMSLLVFDIRSSHVRNQNSKNSRGLWPDGIDCSSRALLLTVCLLLLTRNLFVSLPWRTIRASTSTCTSRASGELPWFALCNRCSARFRLARQPVRPSCLGRQPLVGVVVRAPRGGGGCAVYSSCAFVPASIWADHGLLCVRCQLVPMQLVDQAPHHGQGPRRCADQHRQRRPRHGHLHRRLPDLRPVRFRAHQGTRCLLFGSSCFWQARCRRRVADHVLRCACLAQGEADLALSTLLAQQAQN